MNVDNIVLPIAMNVITRHNWKVLFLNEGRWLPFLEYVHIMSRKMRETTSGAIFQVILSPAISGANILQTAFLTMRLCSRRTDISSVINKPVAKITPLFGRNNFP